MSTYVKYIAKRLLISVLVIFGISVFAFLLIHLIPGDPVRIMLGTEADEAAVVATRAELNLDKPLPIQYWLWIKGVFQGNFGRSLILNADIATMIQTRVPVTLWLTIPAMCLSIVLGILIGILCATHRGSFIDQILTVLITAANGLPIFWFGIMLMYLFGVKLGWLPLMGFVSPTEDLIEYLQHAAMPIFILCLEPLTTIARQVRTNMLEVINQDYIRTAKAYGLSTRTIRYKYALKNFLIPIITVIGLRIRNIVGGSFLAEQVFSIAGIGRLVLTSIMNRDYLVIQALIIVISTVVVLFNMVLDIVYGLVDPRIRLGGGQ